MPHISLPHAALAAACLPYALLTPLFAQDRYGAPLNTTIVRAPTMAEDSPRKTDVLASVEACSPAVAHVFVEITEKGQTFKIERPSTGVFVDAEGHFVTFWSLVEEAFEGGKPREARKVRIRTRDGKLHEAALVGHDARTDLALLRVKSSEENPFFPSLELADTDKLRPGDASLVLSYHDGKEAVAFCGVLGRPLGPVTHRGATLAPEDFLITDAAIQTRSQGGAVIDAQRRLLGLASSEHVQQREREPDLTSVMARSFGFCVPVDSIRALCKRVLEKGDSSNPTLLAPPRQARRKERVADAVERAAASIVGVWSGDTKTPPNFEGDPLGMDRREGCGSGVVVDASGFVLTNWHLLRGENATRVFVGGKSYPARLVETRKFGGRGEVIELALLRVELPAGKKLTAIELASSASGILGETVVGLGRPSRCGALSVSAGILSAKRGRSLLQADPNLGNANGGGALIDLSGRLLGVVDGGSMDKRERAFRQRGDRAKAQNNLSFVVGTDAVLAAFDALGERGLEAESGEENVRRDGVTAVADKTSQGLLNIYVSRSSRAASDDDNPFAPAQVVTMVRGLGSGVVIDDSGLALTNWHVVDEATEADGSMARDHVVHARLRDGTVCECEVLSISREDDLALLRLTVPEGREIRAVELGDSDTLRLGETVIAVGNPEGRANSVTAGIVSSKDRAINIKGRWAKYKGLIETDAAINGGNSGGALLDLDGRLVGINSAGGGGLEVTGFAIPVGHVRSKLLNLLLSPQKLRSVYVGMSWGDQALTASGGELRVSAVATHGPAKRAGIEVGDRLLELDGQKLRWGIDLTMRLLERKGGEKLRFTIERAGARRQLELECMAAATWAVQKQLGVEIAAVSAAKENELVREAAIAMHRRYAADPEAMPSQIPEGVLRVVRVVRAEHELAVGDLLLGLELFDEAGGGSLKRFSKTSALQAAINRYSNYEGRDLTLWVYREGKVHVIKTRAKRLFL